MVRDLVAAGFGATDGGGLEMTRRLVYVSLGVLCLVGGVLVRGGERIAKAVESETGSSPSADTQRFLDKTGDEELAYLAREARKEDP